MIRGYVSSDSDDVDELDEFYSEPPVKRQKEPKPLPKIENEQLRLKIHSAAKEGEKINLFLKAADEGDLNTLEELISSGVSVDCSKKQEWTALLKACGSGNFETVQFLLEHGSNPNLHKELLTPLMVCCNHSLTPESSKLNCARLLLQHGAEVNAKDKYGTTALMYASESGYEDIVTELLAVPDIKINMQDKEDLTALFYTVHLNNKNIAKKLISAGIDLSIEDRYGRTAMILALENGLDEMAKLLGFVEEKETVFEEKKTEPSYRFLQQLPDPVGSGGFHSDVRDILDSLRHNDVKEISLPDFLNVTNDKLYDIGIKLKPHRRQILSLIHRFHLHPWRKESIREVEVGVPLCTEDAVAIMGDLAKHLTLANASLQYLDARLTSRADKVQEGTTADLDLITTLYDIDETAERLDVILPKILNHINQMEPEVFDDYVYPCKDEKRNKFPKLLWYIFGVVTAGYFLSAFSPQTVDNIQSGINTFKVLVESYVTKPKEPPPPEDVTILTYISNIINVF